MTAQERAVDCLLITDFMTTLFGNEDLQNDCVDMIAHLMHIMVEGGVNQSHAITVAREHFIYERAHPDE